MKTIDKVMENIRKKDLSEEIQKMQNIINSRIEKYKLMEEYYTKKSSNTSELITYMNSEITNIIQYGQILNHLRRLNDKSLNRDDELKKVIDETNQYNQKLSKWKNFILKFLEYTPQSKYEVRNN